MRTLFLLLATSLAAVQPMPVLAGTEGVPLTVTGRYSDDGLAIRVPYGDLQLARADDAAQLRARVDRASHKACGILYDGTTPSQRWVCHNQALDVAAPQIERAIASAATGLARTDRAMVLRFARR